MENYRELPFTINQSHSYCNESTGFLRAAFTVWKLTIIHAIRRANTAAKTNIHRDKSIR